MKTYSQDLRDRVIELYQKSRYKIKAISELLGIERHTISSWIKRYKKVETIAQGNTLRVAAWLSLPIRRKIVEFLAANPDRQGIDIRDRVAPGLEMSTFYDTLRRMEITYKKRAKIQRWR